MQNETPTETPRILNSIAEIIASANKGTRLEADLRNDIVVVDTEHGPMLGRYLPAYSEFVIYGFYTGFNPMVPRRNEIQNSSYPHGAYLYLPIRDPDIRGEIIRELKNKEDLSGIHNFNFLG